MNAKGLISIIDHLAHKNKLITKKVQGTLIDDAYHYILGVISRNV